MKSCESEVIAEVKSLVVAKLWVKMSKLWQSEVTGSSHGKSEVIGSSEVIRSDVMAGMENKGKASSYKF